jgi:hypothetical protein
MVFHTIEKEGVDYSVYDKKCRKDRSRVKSTKYVDSEDDDSNLLPATKKKKMFKKKKAAGKKKTAALKIKKKKETEWKREKRQYAMDQGRGVWVCFVLFLGIFDSFFWWFFFGVGLIFASFVQQDDQRTADTGFTQATPTRVQCTPFDWPIVEVHAVRGVDLRLILSPLWLCYLLWSRP